MSVELSGKVKKSVQAISELRDPVIVKEVVSQLMDNAMFKDALLNTLGITAMHHKIESLENKIDDLEQYSRRNCLKFRGIPESSSEDTDQLIIDACNKYLGGLMITQDDISRSHRVGPQNKNFPRDIIVRFISYRTRAAVYDARFVLFNNKVGSDTNSDHSGNAPSSQTQSTPNLPNLYINEALTRARSLVYSKARYLKTQNLISGTWTKDGRIVIRSSSGEKTQVTRLDELSAYPDPPPKKSGPRTTTDWIPGDRATGIRARAKSSTKLTSTGQRPI